MPIRIQSDLPAREILDQENIFVMDEGQADLQGRRESKTHRKSDTGGQRQSTTLGKALGRVPHLSRESNPGPLPNHHPSRRCLRDPLSSTALGGTVFLCLFLRRDVFILSYFFGGARS